MGFREIPSLVKAAALEWSEDNASRHAAALSYYALFSTAPLLLIAIAVAGFVFGEDAARGTVARELEDLIGARGAQAVQAMIEAADKPRQGLAATALGLGALLLGASGAFSQLKASLNTLWEVKPRRGLGLKAMARSHLLGFAMVLALAFLLLLSMVASAGVSAAGAWQGSRLPFPAFLLRAGELSLTFLMTTLIFATLFKVLPDARVRWRDVWVGASVTAFLFAVGRYLIGLYFGRSALGSAYGAAGSLVLYLLWVYYSSQIFFFGAEFTQVHAARSGRKVEPDWNAVEVAEVAVRRGHLPEISPGSSPEAAPGSVPGATTSSVPGVFLPARAQARSSPRRRGRRRIRGALGSAAVVLSLAWLAVRPVVGRLAARGRRAHHA